MLNYIAAQFYTFCLRGPMLDPAEITMGSGTPQSMRLTKAVWLDRLVPGTRIHTGVYLALFLAFAVWLLLWRTSWGYRMRAAGAGERAARYGGIGGGPPRRRHGDQRGLRRAGGAVEVAECTGGHRGITGGYDSRASWSLSEDCIQRASSPPLLLRHVLSWG